METITFNLRLDITHDIGDTITPEPPIQCRLKMTMEEAMNLKSIGLDPKTTCIRKCYEELCRMVVEQDKEK